MPHPEEISGHWFQLRGLGDGGWGRHRPPNRVQGIRLVGLRGQSPFSPANIRL